MVGRRLRGPCDLIRHRRGRPRARRKDVAQHAVQPGAEHGDVGCGVHRLGSDDLGSGRVRCFEKRVDAMQTPRDPPCRDDAVRPVRPGVFALREHRRGESAHRDPRRGDARDLPGVAPIGDVIGLVGECRCKRERRLPRAGLGRAGAEVEQLRPGGGRAQPQHRSHAPAHQPATHIRVHRHTPSPVPGPSSPRYRCCGTWPVHVSPSLPVRRGVGPPSGWRRPASVCRRAARVGP